MACRLIEADQPPDEQDQEIAALSQEIDNLFDPALPTTSATHNDQPQRARHPRTQYWREYHRAKHKPTKPYIRRAPPMETPTEQQPVGIDVSHYQGAVRWNEVASAKPARQFAIIKRTEGTTYVDAKGDTNTRNAVLAGLIVGAYHFFSHDLDPLDQVAHALKVAGNTLAAGVLPLALDVEPDPTSDQAILNPQGQAIGTKYPASYLVRQISKFTEAYRHACGEYPLFYSYPYFIKKYLADTHNFTMCPLWIAAYPYIRQPLPGGWQYHTFHQYSDRASVPGVGRSLVDRFNGSYERLRVLSHVS